MFFFIDAYPLPLRVPVEYPSGQGVLGQVGGEGKRGALGSLLQATHGRHLAPLPMRTRPMAPSDARELLAVLEDARPGLCAGDFVDAVFGVALAERYFRVAGDIDLLHTRTALGDMLALRFDLQFLGPASGPGPVVPATAWWDPSELTYTLLSPLTATSPTGPAASNALRGWDDKIGGARFSLAANGGDPNSGMPRHHTPADGTGIGGWHSIEFWDGGNWLTCTDETVMALAAGHVAIVVFQHYGGGALETNSQTLLSWRGVEADEDDEAFHRMRRSSGQWRTERRAQGTGGGAPASSAFGASNNGMHIRTDIYENGVLTQRLDSVTVVEEAALEAEPCTVTKLHLGNSNMDGRQGSNLSAYVGDVILAPPGYSYALREAVLMATYGG